MLDTIPVLQMDKYEAARQLRLYNEHLKGRLTKADQLMKKAYRELARGRRIVNLEDAFRVTGLNGKHQPRLAIARADWSEVFFSKRYHYGQTFGMFSNSSRYWKEAPKIPIAVFNNVLTYDTLRAATPITPPQHRPPDELDRYYLLYEAAWQEIAPVDPFLLKIIKWPLAVILAHWDLTPVERMIFGVKR